jgi:hypothetical protein
MLRLDEPAQVDAAAMKKSRLRSQAKKVKCTTLACQNGVWENDYLTESERRMTGSSEEPKVGLKTIISQLQAKLQEMKVKFSEIRARYSYDGSNLNVLGSLWNVLLDFGRSCSEMPLLFVATQLCVRTGKGNECTHLPARPAGSEWASRYH